MWEELGYDSKEEYQDQWELYEMDKAREEEFENELQENS